jgi:hypothetical protein
MCTASAAPHPESSTHTIMKTRIVLFLVAWATFSTAGCLPNPVTAIIHPARDISGTVPARTYKSAADTPMKEVNREMTVEQPIDIVAFLQPTYRQIPPAPSGL